MDERVPARPPNSAYESCSTVEAAALTKVCAVRFRSVRSSDLAAIALAALADQAPVMNTDTTQPEAQLVKRGERCLDAFASSGSWKVQSD